MDFQEIYLFVFEEIFIEYLLYLLNCVNCGRDYRGIIQVFVKDFIVYLGVEISIFNS